MSSTTVRNENKLPVLGPDQAFSTSSMIHLAIGCTPKLNNNDATSNDEAIRRLRGSIGVSAVGSARPPDRAA